jgi:hypothetical protein
MGKGYAHTTSFVQIVVDQVIQKCGILSNHDVEARLAAAIAKYLLESSAGCSQCDKCHGAETI